MADSSDIQIHVGKESLENVRTALGALWASIQDSDLNEEYKVWHSQQLAEAFTGIQHLVGANAALEEAVRQLTNALGELQWQRNVALDDLAHERSRNLADVRELLVKDIAHRLGVMDAEARLFLDVVTGQGFAEITGFTEAEIANIIRDVAQEVADS